jgi:hypothetical protein
MGTRTAASVIAGSLLLALTAGCSGSKGAASPAAQQPGASSTPTGVGTTAPTAKPFPALGTDPCLLLTPQLAVQALGPTARKNPRSGSTAATKRCNYQQGSSLSYAEVGVGAKSRSLADFDGFFGKQANCHDLTGFGEKAYRCDPVRSSTSQFDLFYAVWSGGTVVYVGVDIMDAQGHVQPTSFDRTLTLAHAVLG